MFCTRCAGLMGVRLEAPHVALLQTHRRMLLVVWPQSCCQPEMRGNTVTIILNDSGKAVDERVMDGCSVDDRIAEGGPAVISECCNPTLLTKEHERDPANMSPVHAQVLRKQGWKCPGGTYFFYWTISSYDHMQHLLSYQSPISCAKKYYPFKKINQGFTLSGAQHGT